MIVLCYWLVTLFSSKFLPEPRRLVSRSDISTTYPETIESFPMLSWSYRYISSKLFVRIILMPGVKRISSENLPYDLCTIFGLSTQQFLDQRVH